MGTKGVAELQLELAEARARIDALEGEAHLAKTLSRILDGTPAYITHLDLGARILYLSKLQPGFTPDSYKGKTVFDFTDPKDHGALRACLETALRTKDAASHTSVGAGAHGKPTRYFTRVAPIVEDGEVTSFVLLATDVTELTAVIGALEESEKNLGIALGASRMGLWSFDPEERGGSVTDARTREIFGLEPGAIKADAFARIDPSDLPVVQAALAEALHTDGHYGPLDLRIVSADGTKKWVQGFGSVVRSASGRRRVVGGVIDVTERKRAEQERMDLEAQLHQARRIESVGRLAGGVAHDFNNMLAVILAHGELVKEHLDPTSPLIEDVAEILKATERSAALTRQLLAFARKQAVAPVVLDVNDSVASILTMLRRLLGENIQLTWSPGAEVWPVLMDSSQLDQVLTNLCVNARDAIATVGKLTVETGNVTLDAEHGGSHAGSAAGDYVRLTVRDDGCGMDTDTQSHLFEPFFTTKAVGDGTGLGLATVHGIVTQSNGFIDVESEPGRGTTFTILLPRHPGTVAHARTDREAAQAVRGHETILLVEDEPAVMRATKRLLEGMGYVVLTASTPAEALLQADRHGAEIHLLVTDVVMPEMSGPDLAKNLLSQHPHLKRLFISGFPAHASGDGGVLEKKMFLQKPFSKAALGARVREALDDRRS